MQLHMCLEFYNLILLSFLPWLVHLLFAGWQLCMTHNYQSIALLSAWPPLHILFKQPYLKSVSARYSYMKKVAWIREQVTQAGGGDQPNAEDAHFSIVSAALPQPGADQRHALKRKGVQDFTFSHSCNLLAHSLLPFPSFSYQHEYSCNFCKLPWLQYPAASKPWSNDLLCLISCSHFHNTNTGNSL